MEAERLHQLDFRVKLHLFRLEPFARPGMRGNDDSLAKVSGEPIQDFQKGPDLYRVAGS